MNNSIYYTIDEIRHLDHLYGQGRSSMFFQRQLPYYQSRDWQGKGMHVDGAVVLEHLNRLIKIRQLEEKMEQANERGEVHRGEEGP